MKAIVLARVSTKEQEEGHSIGAQRQRLADYCARKGLNVIKTFELVESSTRGERREFTGMLDFAKAQGETVAIVADAVDRFQRSFKESVLIDELIRTEKVELHFYREGMVIGKGASSTDILRWDFSVMGAKSYVLNLSENVRRSLDYKRRNGEWGGTAPIGYLNARDANGRSTIVPDPERAFLVRMLFEDYAKGCHSISGDMVKKAKEWGLRNKTRKGGTLSAGQMHSILTNAFYHGEMVVKGKLYPHVYEPLISKELFDRCQEVRLNASRPTAVRYSEKPFVFRGLLKCAVSGRVVTSDVKKGRHVYLICRDLADPDKKLFVPEREVLEQVADVFRSIRVPETVLDALLAHLRASHEAENQFHKDAIAGLRRDYDQSRDRLATLLDLRLDKSITQDEYDRKARELKDRQVEIATRIEQHQEGEGRFVTTLESLISVASRAAELFERSEIEQKRQLIAFVFSNLRLRGKKLEYSLRSPFDLMVGRSDYAEWLAFLDTVRTERFTEIVDLRDQILELAA
jgi:DNA invertase Pin-like site-specific DNA recombinase